MINRLDTSATSVVERRRGERRGVGKLGLGLGLGFMINGILAWGGMG